MTPAVAGAEARAGDAEAALRRERDARSRAEARVAELERRLSGPRGIASFALAAGALRSGGTLARVALPKDAVAVRLQLELAGEHHALYRATVSDAEGEELWSASKLGSEESGDRRVVSLVLPAGSLKRGDYQVRLFGGAAPDQLEAVGTYAFRATETPQ